MTDHRSRPSPWCAPPLKEATATWRESCRAVTSCLSSPSRSSGNDAWPREPPEGSAFDLQSLAGPPKQHGVSGSTAPPKRVGVLRRPRRARPSEPLEPSAAEATMSFRASSTRVPPVSMLHSCLGASPERGRIDSAAPSPSRAGADTEVSTRGSVGRGGGTSSTTSARADGGAYELGNRVSVSSIEGPSRGRSDRGARRETLCD